MTQVITRLYANPEDATAAVNALKKAQFTDEEIHVVGPTDPKSGEPHSSDDAIAAAIAKGYVLKSHAKIYAEGVRRGGAVVTVHAPWGFGVDALEILDKHNPVEAGVPGQKREYLKWDDAAPVSSALVLPVLHHDPAPVSSFWNLPTKVSGRTFPVAESTKGLTSAGLPLISRNAAPLSSLFGLPTVIGQSSKPAPAAKAAR